MFQQLGYKTNEMRQWFSGHFFSKGLTSEHLLFNGVILIMLYFLAEHITLTSGAIIMSMFTVFWFTGTSRYKADREKKPLVYTPRLKRLGGLILLFLIPAWYILLDFGTVVLTMRDFASPFLSTDPYFMSFGLVLIDMFIPMFLFLAAWLIKPVETAIQNGFKKMAKKKLKSIEKKLEGRLQKTENSLAEAKEIARQLSDLEKKKKPLKH